MSIQQSNEYFDWTFYKLVYHSNNKLIKNYDDCINDFFKNGLQSKKYINEYLNYGNELIKFDYIEYNNRYNLQFNDYLSTLKHWNNIGIYLGYNFKLNNNINNLSIKNNNDNNYVRKIAIIYVYYNRCDEYFNETNLSFFIRQTILKESENSNKYYLFYINNSLTEINFPKRKNIEIIYNENCFDFDAYGQGIRYLQNKFKNFYNIFSHILLINSSVTGPFIDSNQNKKDYCWLQKFNDKIQETSSIVCTNVVSNMNNNFNIYNFKNIKIPGYLIYFKNLEFLINSLYEVLFRKKKNKIDCIHNGEFKFTDVLIKNNFKFTSLSHDLCRNINVPLRYDRNVNHNLYDIVFIKVNWRSTLHPNRDSLPVRPKEIFNMINYHSNFKINNYSINYDNINCSIFGKHDWDSRFSWTTKKKFYQLYGFSEEYITFPNTNKINSVALYSHYSNKNIINNYCIEAIRTLIELGFDIILLTNCTEFNNVNYIPCKKIIIQNSTNDYFMIKTYLSDDINIKNIINNYEYLLFVNDSIAFPIREFELVQKTFIEQRNRSDFWGLWTSPEQKKHIISSFIEFNIKDNKNLFENLLDYINKFDLSTKENAIKLEVNLLEHLQNLKYKYSVVVEYNTLNNLQGKICPIFHPEIFPQWISRPEVFAFKIKYQGNYLNKIKLNNPYLNYLLRFWHFDHTGPKGEPEKQKVYKNPIFYLNYN
jgi:hypothetical protein